MFDDTGSANEASGAAAISEPPGRPGLIRSIAHRLAGEQPELPIEGHVPSLVGATGWLNSEPLTPEGLRGRVVLFDFWTYTCVNWLRTAPYVRAWAAKYAAAGLKVVGIHTPEFGFERDLDNVVAHTHAYGVEYPVAIDSDYGVWRAFSNHFWPAAYIADGAGPDPLPSLRRGRVRDDRDGHPAAVARRRRQGHSTRTWSRSSRRDSRWLPTGGRSSRPRPTWAMGKPRVRAGGCRRVRCVGRVPRTRAAAPQLLGPHGGLDREPGCGGGQRARRTDRVPVPRA